jgi:hypothetical protein
VLDFFYNIYRLYGLNKVSLGFTESKPAPEVPTCALRPAEAGCPRAESIAVLLDWSAVGFGSVRIGYRINTSAIEVGGKQRK